MSKRKASLALSLLLATCSYVHGSTDDNGNEPFGWATCSDEDGTPYTVDGGWHNGSPKTVVLYASGGDDRSRIFYAIQNYDIVILDGSRGDFVVSKYISFSNLKNKSIMGRNGARLRTEWYITDKIRKVLTEANLSQYSSQSGTGGTLSNGVAIDEQQEQMTRQTLIDFYATTYPNEDEPYRHSGFFSFGNTCENIIVRNLIMQGPGSVDVGGADLITVYGANHVWIDHCEFIDGMDGNLDSRLGDNYVTYSWNVFRYTARSFSHSLSNLVVAEEGHTQHVTMANNIWGKGCQGRMPAIGFLDIHLLNNYYDCGNYTAVGVSYKADILLENNYAENTVKTPFRLGSDHEMYYTSNGNIGFGAYNDATNAASPITVPYEYSKIAAGDVPALLSGTTGAGATLPDNYITAMAGNIEDADQQTFYIISAGETFASGSTVTRPNITMTFGEAGGADFIAAASSAMEGIFTAYTPGNGVNGNQAGGTFYVFEPACDGTLTTGIRQNRTKPLYVLEDGTPLPDINGITLEESEPTAYSLTFNVKGGSKYKMYCTASKLGFYGFVFSWKETTAVELPVWTARNGHTARPKAYYNLLGQRIASPHKGIFIVDGRKEVAR